MKITDGVEVVTQYWTSDNTLFRDLDAANKHQEELNTFDYKKAYFELLKEVEELKRSQVFADPKKRPDCEQPFPMDYINNGGKKCKK